MPLPSRARSRRSLLGSAILLGERKGEALSGYSERRTLPWQQRALRVVDLIPELDYVSRFYARMLKQLRLYPALRDTNGNLEEITDGEPVQALARIQGPGGGQSQILAGYGRLMFITGEGNLFGYDLNTEDESWLFIWNDELRVERTSTGEIKTITWTPSDSTHARTFGPGEAVVYKFWTPHPRRSGEATSPLRAIVEGDIAEELIALTRSVRATAVSRATQGILVVPQELSQGPASDEGDEDPELNPLLAEIAAHLEAQIEQAGEAAAAAPYLLEVPSEYAEAIRLVQLHNPENDYLERDLRKEAVERIARGVDFPPEALIGIGSTNHWAALQILMDMWRSHGAPIAQQFCDDLSAAYLRPALREAGFARWNEVVVAYDESRVVVKPDRSEDARVAIREGAIGPRGFRRLVNIPEDFAPSEEELALMLELRRARASREQPRRDPVAQGPEPPGPEGDSGRRTRVVASAAENERELGAIELALMRCRELAGIRILQKGQKTCPECLGAVDGAPYSEIAALLGAETLKRMGLSNSLALVEGGADNLRSLLRAWGYSTEQADLFGEIVEVHASRTLLERDFPKLPEHFAFLSEQIEAT